MGPGNPWAEHGKTFGNEKHFMSRMPVHLAGGMGGAVRGVSEKSDDDGEDDDDDRGGGDDKKRKIEEESSEKWF